MNLNTAAIDKIRETYNLSLIILHGSQIDHKTHSESDIDIAVIRKSPRPLDYLKLVQELSLAFKTHKVDLSDITYADPLFLYSVTSKSKLLSGNPQTYSKLQRVAYHKYNDYLPFLERERQTVQENLKKYVTSR